MRYYVVTVQHNMEANAENRSVPKAYDTKNDAIREFHRQMSTDMGNQTLDWSFSIVFDSNREIIASEGYTRTPVVVPDEEVVVIPDEEPAE